MPEEKSDSVYAAPVKRAVKAEKEKTMAEGHVAGTNRLDATQPLTQTQMAMLAAGSDTARSTVPPTEGSVANYYPGKYQKHETLPEEEPETKKTYVVQPNESIGGIAKKFGVTREALMAANPDEVHGTTKKYFFANRTIVIPEKEPATEEKPQKTTAETEIKEPTQEISEAKAEEIVEKQTDKPAQEESKVPESEKKEENKTGEETKEDSPYLKLPKGQLTFDVEGNNTPGNPYYSRIAHWPGGKSGVTIGRGFDLGCYGTKEDTIKELEEAGIDSSKFEGTIGLRGKKAKQWLDENMETLPEISEKQQWILFNNAIKTKEEASKRLATNDAVTKKYGATNWDELNPLIKEMLLDLTYRGDYTPDVRTFLQYAVVKNDPEAFYKEICDWSKWSKYTNVNEQRFDARVNYMAVKLGKQPPEIKKESRAKALLGSWVGDITSKRAFGASVNLGNDVKIVQDNLLRLGILNQKDYNAELAKGEKEIPVENLQKTIEAIVWFQSWVLGFGERYGYVHPSKSTIVKLKTLSVEEKEAKYKAVRLKKEKEAAEELKNAKEVGGKEKEEKSRKEDPDKILAQEIIEKGKDHYGIMGMVLAKYAKNRPNVVYYALEFIGYYKEDNLAVKISKNLTTEDLRTVKVTLLEDLVDRMKDVTWYLPGGIFTDDYKEIIRLEKVIKIRGGTAKKKDKETEQDAVKVSKDVQSEADKDLDTLRKATKYSLSGSVGKEGKNYPIDVRYVAAKFRKNEAEVSDESMKNGVCDSKLIAAIKELQKGLFPNTEEDELDCRIDPGGGTYRKLFGLTKNFKTNVKDIHASRGAVNVVLNQGLGISAAVGKTSTKLNITAINDKDDVKKVALLLKKAGGANPKAGIKVPKKSLEEGKCNEELITAIKNFEKFNGKKQYGIVSKGGGNIKLLRKYEERKKMTIGKVGYASGTGKYKEGTESEEYYKKIDVLEENLDIKEESDIGKILAMARKAATDQEYFNALTKDVTARLSLTQEMIKDRDVSLSPVLVERMRRYHKFLSAAGLFKGDMTSSVGGGVRSAETAHIWCGQWIIAAEAAGSRNGATYLAETKKILKEMYKEQKSKKGDFVIDKTGNKWAKKEHFKEKDGKIIMDWSKIKTFVAGIKGRRTRYKSPANSGYPKGDKRRRPVPPQSPNITNHKSGEAIDINASSGFLNKKDPILDAIALNFGVVRCGSAPEWWHFELTDLKLSKGEQRIAKNKTYPKLAEK